MSPTAKYHTIQLTPESQTALTNRLVAATKLDVGDLESRNVTSDWLLGNCTLRELEYLIEVPTGKKSGVSRFPTQTLSQRNRYYEAMKRLKKRIEMKLEVLRFV